MTNPAQNTTTQATGEKLAAGVLKRSRVSFIDPRLLVIDPEWNNRFDMGDIEELADSIKYQLERDPESGGLLHHIGVRRLSKGDPLRFATNPLDKKGEELEKEFAVSFGHRRSMAIWHLLSKGVVFPVGVPADMQEKGMSVADAIVQLFVENNATKPLLPVEEAAALKRLHDELVNDPSIKKADIYKVIGKKVGRSDIYVWETMQLLGADEEVKEAVTKGEIGATAARQIAIHAKGDKSKQKELVAAAKQAKKGDKSAKAALKKGLDDSRRAKHASKGRQLKIRALNDAELSALGATLAASMAKKLTDANKPLDFDLRKWVASDDKLALAAAFGALEALKAAAGMKINLDF